MTPLEAAQRLVAHGLRDRYNGQCFVCGGLWLLEDPGFCPEIVKHLPTCPVPHLTGVVAALEAAEGVRLWLYDPQTPVYAECRECLADERYQEHAEGCDIGAFERALKGGAAVVPG